MAETTERDPAEAVHCYRHPGRETLLSCSKCERPICTSCMTQAAVGVRCPECARGPASARERGPAGTVRRLALPRDKAIVTNVLVAIIGVVFLVELAQGMTLFGGDLDRTTIALDFGLFAAPVADGEWWRLISAGFLHAGLIHVGFNGLLLWQLGTALELYAGPVRMLAIFVSALLWGSAGALLFAPDSLTVGASGGVFGLMAALYLLERQRGIALLGGSVGGLLLLNLFVTFAIPGISIGGHLGGILGGAAAGFVLSGFGRGHLAYGRLNVGVSGGLAAVIAGAVVAAVAIA